MLEENLELVEHGGAAEPTAVVQESALHPTRSGLGNVSTARRQRLDQLARRGAHVDAAIIMNKHHIFTN